ncbi:MAG: hypothetical protein ACOX2O_01070 [Bdellovibrionota bacterium]|jgi:hypothetical protein
MFANRDNGVGTTKSSAAGKNVQQIAQEGIKLDQERLDPDNGSLHHFANGVVIASSFFPSSVMAALNQPITSRNQDQPAATSMALKKDLNRFANIPNLPSDVDPLIHPTSTAAQDASASVTNTSPNLATKEQTKIIADILHRRDPRAKLTSFTVTWNEESREYTFSIEKMGSDGKLYHTIRTVSGKPGKEGLAAAFEEFQKNISTGRWKVAEKGGLPKDTEVVTSAKPAPSSAVAGNNVNVGESEITRHDSTDRLEELNFKTYENHQIVELLCNEKEVTMPMTTYYVEVGPTKEEKRSVGLDNFRKNQAAARSGGKVKYETRKAPTHCYEFKTFETDITKIQQEFITAMGKGELKECQLPSNFEEMDNIPKEQQIKNFTTQNADGKEITFDIKRVRSVTDESATAHSFDFIARGEAGPYRQQYHSERIIADPNKNPYPDALDQFRSHIKEGRLIEASSQKGLNGVPVEPKKDGSVRAITGVFTVDELSRAERDIVDAFIRGQKDLGDRFGVASVTVSESPSELSSITFYCTSSNTSRNSHKISLEFNAQDKTELINNLVVEDHLGRKIPNPEIIEKLKEKIAKVDRLANNPNLQKPFTLATGKAGVDNLFRYDENGYKYVNEHFHSYADAPALRDHIINANKELHRFAKEKNLPSINITDFGVSEDGRGALIVFEVGTNGDNGTNVEYALELKDYISFDGVGRIRLTGGYRSLCHEVEKVIGRGNAIPEGSAGPINLKERPNDNPLKKFNGRQYELQFIPFPNEWDKQQGRPPHDFIIPREFEAYAKKLEEERSITITSIAFTDKVVKDIPNSNGDEVRLVAFLKVGNDIYAQPFIVDKFNENNFSRTARTAVEHGLEKIEGQRKLTRPNRN